MNSTEVRPPSVSGSGVFNAWLQLLTVWQFTGMYNNGTGNDGTYNLGVNNTGNFNRGIGNDGDANQGELMQTPL